MRNSIVIAALLLAGCGPLSVQPSGPSTPDNPVQPAAVETIMTVLADSIDRPDTLPKNTTQLELMLRHLRSVQAITDEQVAAVKAAVDCSMHADLTKDDSDKIRSLK